MNRFAVIVAGGSGTRMGGGIPKQFRSLKGRPVLWWSMKAFNDCDPATRIILVLPKDFISLWEDFYSTLPEQDRIPYEATSGGDSRTQSVSNGLKLVEANSLVAIHDGARPLVTKDLILRGWETAEKTGCAIPVVYVTDSLRYLNEPDKATSNISRESSVSVDRSRFVAVQTPQVFNSDMLKDAYLKAEGKVFTDDAAVMENAGHKVTLYEGDHSNFKITHPKDLTVAALYIGNDD